MNTLIRSENIVKSFGLGDEKRNVLDGVSVDIRQGEFVS
ncbi:MAG: ABC transporter ATP-binding protein, partial [Anaerolineae bacterium]|nr:ABC transporter ATP-binding protein [Anaerolineae bacterium]